MLTSRLLTWECDFFVVVAKMATVAGETTQQQGYLNETNATHLHKDALTLVFLMEALREEIYKSLRGGGNEWGENTHELHQSAGFVAMET